MHRLARDAAIETSTVQNTKIALNQVPYTLYHTYHVPRTFHCDVKPNGELLGALGGRLEESHTTGLPGRRDD